MNDTTRSTPEIGASVVGDGVNAQEKEAEGPLGPWMAVERRRRSSKGKAMQKVDAQPNINGGNRFAALGNDETRTVNGEKGKTAVTSVFVEGIASGSTQRQKGRLSSGATKRARPNDNVYKKTGAYSKEVLGLAHKDKYAEKVVIGVATQAQNTTQTPTSSVGVLNFDKDTEMQVEKDLSASPSHPPLGTSLGASDSVDGTSKSAPSGHDRRGGEIRDENGVDMVVDPPSPLVSVETHC